MNHLIEVPLWQLLILAMLALPTAGTLGKYLGYKVAGPLVIYIIVFVVGYNITSTNTHTGKSMYYRLRGFKAVKYYKILLELKQEKDNERN